MERFGLLLEEQGLRRACARYRPGGYATGGRGTTAALSLAWLPSSLPLPLSTTLPPCVSTNSRVSVSRMPGTDLLKPLPSVPCTKVRRNWARAPRSLLSVGPRPRFCRALSSQTSISADAEHPGAHRRLVGVLLACGSASAAPEREWTPVHRAPGDDYDSRNAWLTVASIRLLSARQCRTFGELRVQPRHSARRFAPKNHHSSSERHPGDGHRQRR